MRVGEAPSPTAFHASLRTLFSRVHRTHPGAHLWCKDEASNFLGACPLFIEASGLSEETLLSGINDYDPRLPWTRQAGIYIRDDREVFQSQTPKLNIVERQDRENETIWLKTSKVPYRNEDRSTGGTVGGFAVISASEALALSRQS